MPLRPPAGFISAFYDPLKVANAPTIGTATGGDTSASVAFTAPTNTGGAAITQYYAVSNPGRITGNAASSPVTVSGLTNGTSYTFTVWALNSYGPSPYSAASGSVTPSLPVYGIFAGGNPSGEMINVIQYVVIATTGNSVDVGDLIQVQGRGANGVISSSTRGIMAAGSNNVSYTNVIQYMTIATTGNALDFGDCSGAKISCGGCSSSTRGIIAGGNQSSVGDVNTIEYITISTTGDTIDFGDLTQTWTQLGGVASTTRGVFACSNNYDNVINYITIATTGNAVDFGDLNSPRRSGGACSNSTTGLFAGGYTGSADTADVQAITIASTGNSYSFGTLSVARTYPSGVSSSTRALFAGGENSSTYTSVNVIDYLSFAAGGSASDFGDLLTVNKTMFGISSGHGGL